MRFPHPFCCGLFGLKTGAESFALMHTLCGFFTILPYVQYRVALSTRENAVNRSDTIMIGTIFFGLIFNFILNVVLFQGITKNRLNACRSWLVLGILGGGFWNFAMYDMVSHDVHTGARQELSEGLICLFLASIIYHIYVWYVIFAFTCDGTVVTESQVPDRDFPLRYVANVNTRIRPRAAISSDDSNIDFPPDYTDIECLECPAYPGVPRFQSKTT